MPKEKTAVLVAYEMLEWGGIVRIITGYQTGLKKLGYNVITYCASRNGQLQLDPENSTLMTKWFRPPSINLGWANKVQLKEYKEQVKNADFVLHIHGCPHPTKSSAKGDYDWHGLYDIPRKAGTPQGIVFTDNLWNKLYKWITDVITKDTKLIFINWNAKFDSMEKLPYDPVFLDYPIDFDEAVPSPKVRPLDVIWMPQWKKWKGIGELINQLAQEPDAFQMMLFNSGIEYYNLRKTEVWEKAIGVERRPKTGPDRLTKDYYEKIIHNKKSTVEYFGLLYPEQVNRIYANSRIALDLSGAYAKKFEAQFTCAMAEPMLYKTLVAVPPYVNEDEKSRVCGLDVVYPVDPNGIIGSLEEILAKPKKMQKITERAYKWLKKTSSDDIVAEKLVRIMGA